MKVYHYRVFDVVVCGGGGKTVLPIVLACVCALRWHIVSPGRYICSAVTGTPRLQDPRQMVATPPHTLSSTHTSTACINTSIIVFLERIYRTDVFFLFPILLAGARRWRDQEMLYKVNLVPPSSSSPSFSAASPPCY